MTDDRLIHSFGRRRGRKLRPGRAALLAEALPTLRIALPTDDAPLDPASLFAGSSIPVWLEIGFGGGEHLAAQAAAHPGIGMIGCEPYENGVVALLGQLRDRAIGNVRIWAEGARWPKARHHKRRLVQGPFLDLLARVLAPCAELRVATDHAAYRDWILERLPAHPDFVLVESLARRPADWPETRYEAWAIGEGRQPLYLRLARRGD